MAQTRTKKSKLDTVIHRLLAVLLLIVILSLAFILAVRALPHIAIGQIAELTNTKIEAQSVDLNIDGSVYIRKLVVRPYKKQSYDDTIFKAETVYARFSVGSLFLLRPRLKVIDVSNFVFNAQYDVDTDRWNLSALKIKLPQDGSGQLPSIRLEAGKLQYSKISEGRVKVAASVPVKAELGFDEETQQGYKFDITTATLTSGYGKSHLTGSWEPGLLTLTGGLSSTDISVLEMAWSIDVLAAELKYEPDSDYSFALRIKGLHSKRSLLLDKFALMGPSFLEKSGPFAALQKFFSRYSPAGRINIKLDASGNLKQLAESTLTGIVDCCDVTICDNKFPYPIENLTGIIDFTRDKVTLNNLCGRHGDVKLFFNGWSGGFGDAWQYQTRMTSSNMALDDDLYNALNERQKKFWTVFSPSGKAAIDYRLTRHSPTDEGKTLVVELLGTDAVYQHFPYPLKNLSGRLFFNPDDIIFSNVVSQVNERKIIVNGRAITTGDNGPVYDITIDVNNIPLDSTLEAALPPQQKSLYEQFALAGLGDGHIKVSTSGQDTNSVSFTADLSFRDAFLRSKQLPLAVSDISASGIFTPDMILIKSFVGRHSDGLLSVLGRIWLGQKSQQLQYSLTLSGSNAELNDQLFGLLPKPLERNVLEFQPVGRINYIAVLDKGDSNDYPDYNITVDCLGDGINYKRFPYPLKDITGRLMITKDLIKLTDVTAVPANSIMIAEQSPVIKLNGEIVLTDNDFSSARFQLDACNIFFDEQLGFALPEYLKPLYQKLSPTGWFDVNSADIKISGAEDGRKYVDLDGTVKFSECNFNLPGVISEFTGELKTKCLYKTGYGFNNGRALLSAQMLRIGGKAFTNLLADVYYDNNRQVWFSKNLVADLYGGGLTGELEFKQPADSPLEYFLQVGFDNVDLKQYLSDASYQLKSPGSEPPLGDYTSGKMDGSLSVGFQGGDSYSRVGRCRLDISDIQVGEMSPMAKFLQLLKLTKPRDYAFNRMLVDAYIMQDRVFFEQFDLSGQALAFTGSGWMGLKDRNINLVFAGRGDRLASADPSIFQSLAEGLGRAVVRIEVTGDIYDLHVETKAFPVLEDSLQILGTKPADLNQ